MRSEEEAPTDRHDRMTCEGDKDDLQEGALEGAQKQRSVGVR